VSLTLEQLLKYILEEKNKIICNKNYLDKKHETILKFIRTIVRH